MENFIDDNTAYFRLKSTCKCRHLSHCGNSCPEEECDCFECNCEVCKLESEK